MAVIRYIIYLLLILKRFLKLMEVLILLNSKCANSKQCFTLGYATLESGTLILALACYLSLVILPAVVVPVP
jgi:hypothetical protein